MSANGIQKVTSGRPLRVLRNIAGSPYKKRRGSISHTLEFDIGQSSVHSPHYNGTARGSPGVYQDQDVFSLQDFAVTLQALVNLLSHRPFRAIRTGVRTRYARSGGR